MGILCIRGSTNSSDDYFQSKNNEKQVILILGGPGTGKSTIAQEIANKYNMDFIPKDKIEIFDKKQNKIKPSSLHLQSKIIHSKTNLIIIENYPITYEDLNDWRNNIAESCSVIGCIYLYCLKETMKDRIFQKTANDNISDLNVLISVFINQGIPSFDFIFQFVQTITVSTDRTVEQIVFELSKELEKEGGILDLANKKKL